MNWEMFKSLLLTVLVALSLLLTWNLWNFHSDLQPLEDTDYVASGVSENGKVSLNDVVHPLQAIFHGGHQDKGLQSSKQLKEMFTGVIDARYKRVRQIQEQHVGKKSSQQLKNNSVELVFPHAISVSLFDDMLKKKDEGDEETSGLASLDQDLMFDRVAFYKTPTDAANMRVIFRNGHNPVASAHVKGLAYEDLDHYKKKSMGTFVSTDLADGPVYLPEGKVDVNKVLYYAYKWIDVSKFKAALFRDPHDVLRQGDYFTNGANSLKELDHTIKYINPGSNSGAHGSPNDTDRESIVRDSFDYVNGHSGWTDPYVLFDFKRPPESGDKAGKGNVTFRLMVGDKQSYPVFSRYFGNYPYRDAGTILMHWQDGSVHDYSRTLLDMPSSSKKGAVRHLRSSKQLLRKLKSHEGVKKKQIRDLRIGYDMVYPPDPNTLVFTPKWYVFYGEGKDAHWRKAEDLLGEDEESKSEEADTK